MEYFIAAAVIAVIAVFAVRGRAKKSGGKSTDDTNVDTSQR